MIVKRTRSNQITIPKKIISQFEDCLYFEVQEEEGKIILIPVELGKSEDVLPHIRKKIRALGVTTKDIVKAISAVRNARN